MTKILDAKRENMIHRRVLKNLRIANVRPPRRRTPAFGKADYCAFAYYVNRFVKCAVSTQSFALHVRKQKYPSFA